MADDLGAAPQTGDSGTTTIDAPAPAAADKSAPSKEPVLSTREAINKAMATVERANPPDETAKAAAVLKRGAGADDRLVADHQKTIERAEADERARSEASERAAKGWETRRANAEKAAAEPKEAPEAKPVEAVAAPEAKTAPAPKPEPSKYKPPERMSAEGKAAWDAAPEPLRAEVVRMHDELTNGFAKHKEAADRWAEMADFDKLAKEQGTTVKEALNNYIELDKRLGTDLYGGLDAILKYHGTTLKEVAEQYLGEESTGQGETRLIGELRGQVAQLEKRLGAIDQTVTTQTTAQRQRETHAQVEAFAAAHPRFEELAEAISAEISHGYDLKTAYERAERLNPAPAPVVNPAPAIPAPDLTAQTRKGTASVSGSPASGSNPAQKRPVATSAGEAVRMAMRQSGLA